MLKLLVTLLRASLLNYPFTNRLLRLLARRLLKLFVNLFINQPVTKLHALPAWRPYRLVARLPHNSATKPLDHSSVNINRLCHPLATTSTNLLVSRL